MSGQKWGRVRDCMKKEVTEVDGRIDVLSAMRIMKKAGTTSLIVKRRDEGDEYGMLLFADIAKKVIGKDRSPERVNVYGGACAQGHPIGSTGSRLIVTLAHAMQKLNLKRGVAALCIGGGEATAIALERD